MNSLIEILNHWGGFFLSFAWPMLWQSSLLILILIAFEFLFRRKVRASVRYGLWLILLVKLCVSPTLALPTSPAWWLQKTPPPIARPETRYTVTYDNSPLTEIPQTPPAFVPPKPAMTFAAWLLMISISVSLALFVWLLVRWWQITRQVRRAKTSERLIALANEAREIVGKKLKTQVKLTTNSMAPAVCGLFRPAILIPQSLAENFSDEQLRAVLLHELIHLRRRDVWVNFFQALLQIFYWWHPPVWLANARIRRVREEAVDDAVMLALRDEAETYAPTLLEVAKLALNRPLVSLGLVGILESRHALRQRIERLMDFRPPRKAGLTLVSLLGILAFTAVAVPMAERPAPAENETVSAPVPAVSAPPAVLQKTNWPLVLVTTHFYQAAAALKSGQDKATAIITSFVPPAELTRLQANLESEGYQKFSAPRVATLSGETAEMFVGNGTNSVSFFCCPTVTNGLIELMVQGQVVYALNGGLATNEFKSRQVTLENHGAAMISVAHPRNSGLTNLIVLASVEIITHAPHFQQRLQTIIKREPTGSFENPETLVQEGKLLYEMGKLDESEAKSKTALAIDSENAAAQYYLGLAQAARQKQNFPQLKPGRQNMVEKLNRIRLDRFGPFEGARLDAVVDELSKAWRQNDPDTVGMNFLEDASSVVINMPAPLENVRLANALDAIVLNASKPIKYSILDDEISFSMKDQTPTLFTRTFKVNPNIFPAILGKQTGLQTNNVSAMARKFFSTLGVDWESPKGKTIFYNDRMGLLFVGATESDLDTIERAIVVLNEVPPQIHIKARFLEVPKGTVANFGNFLNSTNSTKDTFTGILTATNAKIVLHSLESRKGVETLAEPEVTTLSGRQTQMRATQVITVITHFVLQGSLTNGTSSIVPQMDQVEIGPVLDVVPYVLSDGYTINLTLIPSLTEFLGYDKPPNAHLSKSDARVQVPAILPRFSVRLVTATLNLWDGQTVILGGLKKYLITNGVSVVGKSDDNNKEILVFITATIVDPAGNRVHADEEMPFAQKGSPPPPPPK
jgi:beta-lactamase regulating signal transducer with metallopeptidase domain/tetratricopeptide (TPR) repeat protein